MPRPDEESRTVPEMVAASCAERFCEMFEVPTTRPLRYRSTKEAAASKFALKEYVSFWGTMSEKLPSPAEVLRSMSVQQGSLRSAEISTPGSGVLSEARLSSPEIRIPPASGRY